MHVLEIDAVLIPDRVRQASRVFQGMESLFMQFDGFLRADMLFNHRTRRAAFKLFWSSPEAKDAFESNSLAGVLERLSPFFEKYLEHVDFEVLAEIDRRGSWFNPPRS